jgi:hypothetical protein
MKNIKYIDFFFPMGVYLRKQDLRVYMGQIERLLFWKVKSCVLFTVNLTTLSLTHVLIEWHVDTCVTNWIGFKVNLSGRLINTGTISEFYCFLPNHAMSHSLKTQNIIGIMVVWIVTTRM